MIGVIFLLVRKDLISLQYYDFACVAVTGT